jgi:hypothetical protein
MRFTSLTVLTAFVFLGCTCGCGESDAQKQARQASEKRPDPDDERLARELQQQKDAEKTRPGEEEKKRLDEARLKKELEEAERVKQAAKERLDRYASLQAEALAIKPPEKPGVLIPPTNLKGKAILFGPSGPIDGKLPRELQGELGDADLFIFLVVGSSTRPGMEYEVTIHADPDKGIKAEKRKVNSILKIADVRVIDWQAKKVLGTFKVLGSENYGSVYVQDGKIYGLDPPVWEFAAKRFGPPDTLEKFLACKDAAELRAILETGKLLSTPVFPGFYYLADMLVKTKDRHMQWEIIRGMATMANLRGWGVPSADPFFNKDARRMFDAYADSWVDQWVNFAQSK